MKISKIFLPLVAAAAFLAPACTDETEYTPAAPVAVPDYYFTTTNTTNYELYDISQQVTFTVARRDAKGEATVNIASEVSPAFNFTIPSAVTFADGEATKTVQILFNMEDMVVNQPYTIKLSIPGVENTPYSLGSLEYTLLYLPWRDFEEDNSIGLYTETAFSSMFNGVPSLTYPVKMQKHPLKDNVIRLVNPYAPGVWPFSENMGEYGEGDYFMEVNFEDPNKVYIDETLTGITMPGFGPITIISGVPKFFNGVTEAAYCTYKNGIIKGGADPTFLMGLVNGGKYGWYGPLGNVKIILPGFEDEPEWTSLGYCNFTDGLVSPWFGDKDNTYRVEVQQNITDKNLYRIVNPFGQGADTHIDFSIEDPDFVTLGLYELRAFLDATQTKALYYVGSAADIDIEFEFSTPEEAKAAGLGATFKDGKLILSTKNTMGAILNVATMDIDSFENPPAEFATETVLDLNSAVATPGDEGEPKPAAIKARKATFNKGALRTISPLAKRVK